MTIKVFACRINLLKEMREEQMGLFNSSEVDKLKSEVREAYGQVDDAELRLSDLKKKVELAYGLLWLFEHDKSNTRAAYLARKILYEIIDRDSQDRGIEAARTELGLSR
jgi:hypothetical protein